MKQIIYSGVLSILGMIASIDSAIAQVQNPSDTFDLSGNDLKIPTCPIQPEAVCTFE